MTANVKMRPVIIIELDILRQTAPMPVIVVRDLHLNFQRKKWNPNISQIAKCVI